MTAPFVPTRIRTAAAGLAGVLLLCGALGVPAGTASAAQKKASAHRHRVVKPKVTPGPSDEKTADRDRRLTRECKGRPNAGACLGYAQ